MREGYIPRLFKRELDYCVYQRCVGERFVGGGLYAREFVYSRGDAGVR